MFAELCGACRNSASQFPESQTNICFPFQPKERLTLLQRMAEEHQMFQGCVKRFQAWLLTETKRLTTLMERDDSAEDKLRALQVSC